MKLRHILTFLGLIFFLAVFTLFYTGIVDLKSLDFNSKISWFPLLIIIAALVDSINPCAFSVLFITLAFLFSLGQSRGQIIKNGLTYVFGIFLVYILIGLGFLKVLTFFNIPNGLGKVGAIILIIFGIISLLNEFFPRFPIKLKLPEATHDRVGKLIAKATIPASFLLGILVGMFEFPCTGGPYLFVLGLLHDQSSFVLGFYYLVLYNFIFVLPLLIAIFISTDKIILDKLDNLRRNQTKKSRIWLALILIALGLLVFVI